MHGSSWIQIRTESATVFLKKFMFIDEPLDSCGGVADG
jgi:hypothetical protein